MVQQYSSNLESMTKNLIERLKAGLREREVEILRQYGNKDCTAMADDAIKTDEEYIDIKTLIEKLEAETSYPRPTPRLKFYEDKHILGEN